MSCECWNECPLPWTTITAHYELDGFVTQFIDNNSVTAMYETSESHLSATVVYNRVTLDSKGVTGGIYLDGGTIESLRSLLAVNEFFLISNGCCPCRWLLIARHAEDAEDYVDGGSSHYHQDGITGDPNVGTIPAVETDFTYKAGVLFEIATQNAACGKKEWEEQLPTWPYDPAGTTLDGAIASGFEWFFIQYLDGDPVGSAAGELFVYPVDISEGENGDQISYEFIATGSGHGFGDSCEETGMSLEQSVSFHEEYHYHPAISPDDGRGYREVDASGSLSIVIT